MFKRCSIYFKTFQLLGYHHLWKPPVAPLDSRIHCTSRTILKRRVFSTAVSLPVNCCQAILEATGSNLRHHSSCEVRKRLTMCIYIYNNVGCLIVITPLLIFLFFIFYLGGGQPSYNNFWESIAGIMICDDMYLIDSPWFCWVSDRF